MASNYGVTPATVNITNMSAIFPPKCWYTLLPAILAFRQKITIIPGKQSPSIQGCYKTHMDVWHRTMGLRQQLSILPTCQLCFLQNAGTPCYQLYWLLGRKSPLSLENKVLVYRVAIKPIWTYGIELWGCASNWSIATLQRRQSKIVRSMADAPRYVSNSTLHNDFGIPFIEDVLQERSTKHHDRLEVHSNALLQPLLEKAKQTEG